MAAQFVIRKANGGQIFVTPSGGITAISDAGVITLGSISLSSGVTGALPVANGGTGITSGTSGGILAYTATGTLASSGLLAANALVIGGGAGVAPSTTTTGTGVITAAGIAINTTGGFITPSNSTSAGSVLTGGGGSGTAATWSLMTGTGNPVAQTSPSLITPALGVATATSLALGGATIGTNALAITGDAAFTDNTLTTGNLFAISSTSLTTGALLDLTSAGTAAGASQRGLNVSLSGANATSAITTKGGVISNTHTGTTSTNIGLQLTASGAASNNFSLDATAGNMRIFSNGRLVSQNAGTDYPNTYLQISGHTNTMYLASNGGASLAIDGSGMTLANSGILAGGAVADTKMVKRVTSIADNTATTVLTITVPNAAHSASVRVTLTGSLGAGGAIGANEATESITYNIGVARTAGVAMNAVASTAYGDSTSVAVAGAATIAVTGALTLNAEGVGVSNTASFKVTIARGSGSSTNHTCLVMAEVVNANATGVTIQ